MEYIHDQNPDSRKKLSSRNLSFALHFTISFAITVTTVGVLIYNTRAFDGILPKNMLALLGQEQAAASVVRPLPQAIQYPSDESQDSTRSRHGDKDDNFVDLPYINIITEPDH